MRDVIQRICIEDEEIRILAGGEHSHLVQFQVFGGAACRGHYHLHWSHACVRHTFQFALFRHAEEVIFKTGIGPKDNFRIGLRELCNTALGAGDYLAIATHFHTVILDGIPRMSPDNYDQARRFIVLMNTLYDQHVKLIASADALPDQLYQRGENAGMFERTASRLDEMQSDDWLGLTQGNGSLG